MDFDKFGVIRILEDEDDSIKILIKHFTSFPSVSNALKAVMVFKVCHKYRHQVPY